MEIIIAIFKKLLPELTVTLVANFNDDYLLIEAVQNPNEPDYNDPYYLLSKKKPEVAPYLPALDMDRFHKAITDKVLWKYGEPYDFSARAK